MCIVTESPIEQVACSNAIEQCSSRGTKMVQFGAASIRDADEIHSLSEDIIPLLWYSYEERRAIRVDLRECIREGRNGKTTMCCLRGLELGLDRHRRHEKETKIFDVLDLQQRNKAKGMDPAHGLQTLYVALGKNDIQRAIVHADDDANEASCIYKETMSPEAVDRCFCRRNIVS